jgi:hypothetical protein
MFASILGEIEFARLPMLQAYKKVMLGTKAILEPRQVSLGAGPREVDALLDRIQAHESRLKRTARPRQEFFLRDIPAFDADRGGASASLPSFTTEGIKYLFARRNTRRVGLGVAVRYEDFAALTIDEQGRVSYPAGRQLGARPFVVLPPDGMIQAARANEARLVDHGGYGHHLPVYVKLYSDLIAFVLQPHPALLGAHLLYRNYPREAEQLLDEHARLTSEITSRALYFLGYEPPQTAAELRGQKRRDRDNAVLQGSGLRLFQALEEWPTHCCKSLFLEEFAQSYRRISIAPVNDLTAFGHERVTAPPPA